jgi:hypothetical protein
MGGPGSGGRYHWWRPAKKTAVEDCLSIDANRWTREGILKAAVRQTGSWRWTYSSGKSWAVSYEVMTLHPDVPLLRLSYSWTLHGRDEQSADYVVPLTRTYPRFGGLRWWFVCPLAAGGRGCGRRVGKLHLPHHARHFGCRQCHDLTYRSSQESHSDDRLFQFLAGDLGADWKAVRRALRRPE